MIKNRLKFLTFLIFSFLIILLSINFLISCSNPVSNSSTSSSSSGTGSNSGNSGGSSGSTNLKVETPTFSLNSGSYDDYLSVSISTSTDGASIFYTLDGTDPIPDQSELYSSPIFIDKTLTLKAIAVKENYQNSDIAEATYIINKLSKPKFSINSGTYDNDFYVEISCDIQDSTIFYTLDGTDPDPNNSPQYNGTPILINTSVTLKAIAIKDSFINSDISEVNYTLKANEPEFSLEEGTYYEDKNLSITSTTQDAIIYFTNDGSDPKTSPTRIQYTGPITLTGNINIRAYAEKQNYEDSNIISKTYTFECLPPYIDLEEGLYYNNQTIILTSPTPGATIYYTLDGTTPIPGTSQQYTGPINIPGTSPSSNGNYSLRVIAIKNNYNNSIVVGKNYTLKVAKPQFNINPGKYFEETSVSISTSTTGASISYSIDNGHTYNSYVSPITLYVPTNLMVHATKTGFAQSDKLEGFYNILFLKEDTKLNSNNLTFVSLGIDNENYAHISYHIGGPTKTLYYTNNNPKWNTAESLLSTDNIQYPSIAVDNYNNIHIVYVVGTQLKYSTNMDGNWQHSNIDNNGTYPVIKFDTSSEYLHVVYYDNVYGTLKYAKKYIYDNTWDIQTIDNEGDFNSYISLALDSNGNPHVSYYDAISVSLNYAYFNGTEWVKETIDSNGNMGKYSSIALDSNDKVYIAYYHYKSKTTGALKLATNKNGIWETMYIENVTGQNDGLFNKIIVDSNFNIHIIYNRYTSSTNIYTIKYAIIDENLQNIEILNTSGNSQFFDFYYSKNNDKIYIIASISNKFYFYVQN